MDKQEFIKKIQKLREDGEHDLRTVIYFAEQLNEPSREECEVEKLGSSFLCKKCDNYSYRYCSKFGSGIQTELNFCPNCGAKIKEEKKDE